MEKKTAGVIGFLALLLGGGMGAVLTPEDFQNAYYCSLTDRVGVFERLSGGRSTTGYYTVNETEMSVQCRTGNTYETWMPLNEYCKAQDLDCTSFLLKELQPGPIAAPYEFTCEFDGCTAVRCKNP